MYSVIGLVVSALILEIVARSGYLFAKTRAMGEADTYVAAALGAILGKSVLLVLAFSLIASMIFILPVFFFNQYKQNNKFTCIAGILFILSILVYQTLWQNYYSFAALFITGLCLVISILKSIGQVENRNYLPYVPALTAGALYFLFFCI